jgi:hypothetical protein
MVASPQVGMWKLGRFEEKPSAEEKGMREKNDREGYL